MATSKYQDKEYRITENRAPLTWAIKSGSDGNLITFDEDKGYNRAIRHCPNEKSVFLDEQSQFAVLEPINFERGYLKVSAREQHTQKFLELSPENAANGGNVFYLVDAESEAKDDLVLDDLITEMKTIVKERSEAEDDDAYFDLQALASLIEGSWVHVADKPKNALRKIINKAIATNPRVFVKDGKIELFSQESKRAYFALRALAANIIHTSADGRSLIWKDTGKVITNVPSSHTAQDYLIEYLASDDGKMIIEKIAKLL